MILKDFTTFNQIEYSDYLLLKYLEKIGPREGILRAYKMMSEDGKMKYTYAKSYYRIKKLIEQKAISFDAKIDAFKLGLQGTIAIFEINPKYSGIFEYAIKLNPTLVYYSRFYGSFNGYIAQFTIPFGYYYQLKEFLEEIKALGIIRSYRLYVVERYFKTELGIDWYDFKEKKPVFKWNELIEEIKNIKISEPQKEKIEPFYEPDEIDLKILEMIEHDTKISLTNISKALGISVPAVKYHYDNHLIKTGIIKSFLVKVTLFPKQDMTSLYYAILRFKSKDYREKFVEAIKNKHFVSQATRVSEENILTMTLHLPYYEYLNFVRFLWDLIKEGILESYELGNLDTANSFWKVLPYELYKNGKWNYPHDEIIRNLHLLVAKQELNFRA